MAEAKQTPRQKMIGLMYLVLMAMLALNVSKDILESFVQVNESLEISAEITGLKNDQIYAGFEIAKQYDPVRVSESFETATKVRNQSADLVDYIDGLKNKLIAGTERVSDQVADTLQLKNVKAKDNYDVTTNIMIGSSEDGSAGLSKELKERILAYKEELMECIPEAHKDDANIGLHLNGSQRDGVALNWEMTTFYETTLAAALVNLSKLQNDVKNAEYDVVNKLFADVAKVDIPFDTVAPKIVAPTSYVLLGDEYKADIFLAAFNKTKDPKITINNETIPVNHGLGKYNLHTDREGQYTYTGNIEVETNTGELKSFPFESSYIVARPSLTVSPVKMNVLYIGVDNPVSVSVPGVANDNVQVTISGSGNRISRTGNGMYEVKLARNSPSNVHVNVKATMQNGEQKSMGSVAFRVKRLPKPTLSVLGRTTDGRISKGSLRQLQVAKAIYEDFEFNLKPKTLGYTVTVYKRGNEPFTKSTSGKRVPEQIKRALRNVRSGDKLVFERVRAEGPDGIARKISGLTLTVE